MAEQVQNQTVTTPPVATPPVTTPPQGKEGDGAAPKTFTQEQVNEIVGNRVKEVETKFDEKLKTAVSTAVADVERKSKLTQEEREKEQAKQAQEELSKREAEVQIKTNKITAYEEFTKRGMSTTLVDLVVVQDPEVMLQNIAKLETVFKAAVAEAVANQTKGKAPIDPSGNKTQGVPTVMPRVI